jgi:hypothetical protein
MNQTTLKLGYWSAALSAATFIIFSLCFVAIIIVNPLFIWTDYPAYVAYTRENNQFFKDLAQFMMLAFGPLFLILLNSIHDYAARDKKVLSRLAIIFGTLFTAMIGLHYFVQVSIVRQNLAQGHPQGLEQFVQANPDSFISAVNMLGWTLFFGLSCFFLAPVFSGGRLEKTIRYAFLANGLFMILGGVSYILEIVILVFLFMNFGLGAAVLVATISLAILFRRLGKEAVPLDPNTARTIKYVDKLID